MLKKLHIPIPGAFLVLIAFFLPWISVSCLGTTVELSGMDLATGFPELDLSGDFLYWLIPLVAIISLVIAALTMRDDSMEKNTALGHTVLGLAGLILLGGQWFRIRGSLSELDTGFDILTEEILSSVVDVGYGGWLTVIGLLIMLIGGVLSYLESRNRVSGASVSVGSTVVQVPDIPVSVPAPPPINPVAEEAQPGVTAQVDPSFRQEGDIFGESFRPMAPSPKTEVLHREPEAMAWLVVAEGSRAGHHFRLMDNTSIGRDPTNDIVLDDSALSSQHARIKLEDEDTYFLFDLASTNGVEVSAKGSEDWARVYHHELSEGDRIKLGRTIMHFMTVADGPDDDQPDIT